VRRMCDLVAFSPLLAGSLSQYSDNVMMTIECQLRMVRGCALVALFFPPTANACCFTRTAQAQDHLLREGPADIPERDVLTPKQNVHARIEGLFTSMPGFLRPNISGIRSSDNGRFITVSGTVIRTGMMRVVERQRMLRCTNPKCG